MGYRATFVLPDNTSTVRSYDHFHPDITADAIAWAKKQMMITGKNYSYVWADVYFGCDSYSYKIPVKLSPEEERLNRIEKHLGLDELSAKWKEWL